MPPTTTWSFAPPTGGIFAESGDAVNFATTAPAANLQPFYPNVQGYEAKD